MEFMLRTNALQQFVIVVVMATAISKASIKQQVDMPHTCNLTYTYMYVYVDES